MVGHRTLPAILSERDQSSRSAVVCAETGTALSYAELAQIATDLRESFQRHGLRARDRVALLLPNSIEFAAAFFGALAAEAVVMPLDIHLKRADLLRIIDKTGPRILVTNPSLYRKIGSDLRQTTICLLEFDEPLSVGFLDAGNTANDTGRHGPCLPEDDAVLILSSGSTGLPKAVRLSHRAILHNISMHWESLAIEEDIRGLQLLPMNFSYGLIASFLSILHAGGTAVLLAAPEPKSVWDTIDQYGVNLVMGTPALFQFVIENSRATSVSPVRYVTVGGDRCKRYALELLCERLPAAKVFLTYGLTEAGPRVSTLPHHLVKQYPDSVGLPLRGVKVFIRDGEIVVRTPSLMTGYWGEPERTGRVVRDSLLHTGDLGYLDERGLLYCLGRKDRQFKFGGRLVNPNVIEQCLASHPLVREAAVEKVENDRAEWLCARVKAGDAGEEELLPELKRFCRQHMPSYLVPAEFRFEDRDYYYYKGRRWKFAETI